MKGRAPNCSKTGSQTLVTKKAKPNLCRAREEPFQSSKTKSAVRITTEAANTNVIIRAISSPSRRRLKKEREPATGPALGRVVLAVDILALLDVVESLFLFCDHFFRQLRVGQGLRVILSICEHPLYKALEGIS